MEVFRSAAWLSIDSRIVDRSLTEYLIEIPSNLNLNNMIVRDVRLSIFFLLFSIGEVRVISVIKRPASDDRALKSPERRR
jgi:hypothetical protein